MDTTERRSVLVLVASNRRRGAEVFGEHLATGLSALAWDVDFVALARVPSSQVVDASVLSDREALGRLDIATVRSLRHRIRATSPSVVLANGGATLRYAVAARTGLRSRPVLAYSSIGEPRYWIRSKRHAKLQSLLHRSVDVVLAVSDETRDQLIEDLHVNADRIYVAHTGVGPEYFVDPGEPHDELRLVFLGSLSPEKDPAQALTIVKALRDSHDVRLRIVGDGPLASDLAGEVAAASLEALVSFTGSVTDVTPHLAWADLLVLTSKTEGLPGAALEAAAASTPVVAYDVGGTSDTMIDGVTGILVEAGDINAMIRAIDGLAADRHQLVSMGQAARSFIEDNYTLDRSIRRFDAILSDAIAEGNGP